MSAKPVSLATGGGATSSTRGGAPLGPDGSACASDDQPLGAGAISAAETLKRAFMSLQPSAMMTRSSGAWLRRQGGR